MTSDPVGPRSPAEADPTDLDGPEQSEDTVEAEAILIEDSGERREAVVRLSKRELVIGPIPPPTMLRDYEAVVPGSASQMMESARIEGEHRRECERRIVRSNTRAQDIAAITTPIFQFFLLGVFVWLILAGFEAVGIAGIAIEVIASIVIRILEHRETDRASGDG